MDKIIEKISAYNIFTNMFPGAIYCFISDKLFGIPLIQENLLVAIFLYYFCGMVISRIGSIIVEPIFKKAKFVTYADYKDYLAAAADDDGISILLETNNSYRSIVALLLCLLMTGVWSAALSRWPQYDVGANYLLLLALLALFAFSFRKQTQYIVKRVLIHKSKGDAAS